MLQLSRMIEFNSKVLGFQNLTLNNLGQYCSLVFVGVFHPILLDEWLHGTLRLVRATVTVEFHEIEKQSLLKQYLWFVRQSFNLMFPTIYFQPLSYFILLL